MNTIDCLTLTTHHELLSNHRSRQNQAALLRNSTVSQSSALSHKWPIRCDVHNLLKHIELGERFKRKRLFLPAASRLRRDGRKKLESEYHLLTFLRASTCHLRSSNAGTGECGFASIRKTPCHHVFPHSLF